MYHFCSVFDLKPIFFSLNRSVRVTESDIRIVKPSSSPPNELRSELCPHNYGWDSKHRYFS